jgi:hypothetical protein
LHTTGAALAVLLIAGATVVGGVQLVGFAVDVSQVVSLQTSGRGIDARATSAAIVARMSGWRTTPGVGAKARELLAVDPRITKRAARQLLDITDAIAENPTAGRLWLAYARQVLRSGYKVEDALAALRMSLVVERLRAATMLERARIVVGAWERIPDDVRQDSISELAALRRNLGERERASMAQVAATKSPEVRAEIGRMLLPKLGESVWVANAMGF